MNPDQIRAAIRAQLTERGRHERALTLTLSAVQNRNPTPEQDATLRAAREAIVDIDVTLDHLGNNLSDALAQEQRESRAAAMRREIAGPGVHAERAAGGAHIGYEARTYGPGSGQSFILDAFSQRFTGDPQAAQRLARSDQEERAGMQQRAVSTSGLAGLVVPQYLLDAAALALRSGRPVANTAAKFTLPDKGMSILVPRSTTGAAVASQSSENTNVQNTDEVWSNISLPVVTVAGQQVVSRQAIERGGEGLDQLMIRDLTGAYAAEIERQVISGSGASNQMLGILNTSGINAATAFGAAATAVTFMTKVAGAIAAVAAAGSGVAAGYIAMHPRRWAWLLSQNDSTGRPLVSPVSSGPTNALAVNTAPGAYGGDGDPVDGLTIVGYLHGLPVVTSNAIPTNLGTSTTEDVVIVYDSKQALLFEDSPMPRVLNFEQPLASSLGIQIVAYGYAAFTAGRYPQAFSKVGGADGAAPAGLQAPAF